MKEVGNKGKCSNRKFINLIKEEIKRFVGPLNKIPSPIATDWLRSIRGPDRTSCAQAVHSAECDPHVRASLAQRCGRLHCSL